MTHDEAVAECARLGRDDPRASTDSWFPRLSGDGSWGVVHVAGLPSADDVRVTETAADEKPATPNDPRTAMDQNVRYLNP